jgi:hypothetical protein
MVFSDTFNNISVKSWRSVLLMEEPEDPEKTTGARSYIFTSPGICKKRREDTFFAPQSESRISAPFFASKTV